MIFIKAVGAFMILVCVAVFANMLYQSVKTLQWKREPKAQAKPHMPTIKEDVEPLSNLYLKIKRIEERKKGNV